MITEQLWADFELEPKGVYYDGFGRIMHLNTATAPVHVIVYILLDGPSEQYVPKHMAPSEEAPPPPEG
jgi:hypothetical protein